MLTYLKACDPEVRIRRLIELTIIEQLAKDLLAHYTVEVDGTSTKTVKEVLDEVFAVDAAEINLYEAGGMMVGWIQIVLGNDGHDCIADCQYKKRTPGAPDYTPLYEAMQAAEELASLLEEAHGL